MARMAFDRAVDCAVSFRPEAAQQLSASACAIGVVVGELTDLTLPWTDLGPWSVVAAGLVVLIVGAIGLRSSRSRE